MTGTQLVVRYAAFAVLATFANLAAQRIVLGAVSGHAGPETIGSGPIGFALAVFIGTGLGLVVKYILDKRWIFFDTSSGLATHGRKFTLYTLMGIVTTLIFWGTETAFWLAWRTDLMREIGAVLGLTTGYVIKYKLDRRFVFRELDMARG